MYTAPQPSRGHEGVPEPSIAPDRDEEAWCWCLAWHRTDRQAQPSVERGDQHEWVSKPIWQGIHSRSRREKEKPAR